MVSAAEGPRLGYFVRTGLANGYKAIPHESFHLRTLLSHKTLPLALPCLILTMTLTSTDPSFSFSDEKTDSDLHKFIR